MGVKAMARQASLEHTRSIHEPQPPKEGHPCLATHGRRMDDDDPHARPPFEQAPGHRLGPVELGHGVGPLLRLDGSHCLSSRVLSRQEKTVRQQLREWCYEAEAKRGDLRQALVVERCFVPLLALGAAAGGRAPNWPWPSMPPPWACASPSWPSAWSIAAVPSPWPGRSCPPTRPHAWRCEWLRMLRQLRPAIPKARW